MNKETGTVMQERTSTTIRFLLFLLLTIGTGFTLSCQTAGPQKGQAEAEEQEKAQAQQQQAAQEEEKEAESWKDRLKQEQKKNFSPGKAEKLYQIAREQFQKGDYKEAEDSLQEALKLNPGFDKARTLLKEVRVQLGELDRDFESGESILQKWETVKEQQLHKAQVAFKEGKDALDNEEYETAVEKFQEVLSRARYMPVSKPGLKELRKKAETFLEEAKKKQENQRKVRENKRRRAMQKMARQEEFQRRKKRQERVQKILERAQTLFENQKYGKVEKLLEEAEKIDPTIEEIKELKRLAWRMRHREESRELSKRTKREFRKWRRKVKERMLTQSKIVRFPEEKEWEKIKAREPKSIRREEEEQKECEKAIISKLETTPLQLELQEGMNLSDVIDLIRRRVNINIDLHQNIPDPDQIPVNPMTFGPNSTAMEVLNLVLDTSGGGNLNLDFTFRECILLITTQEQTEKPKLQIYEIKDLSLRLRDFPGPDINLPGAKEEDLQGRGGGGGGGGGGGVGGGIGGIGGGGGGGGEEKDRTAFSPDQIKQLVQDTIAPESWGGTDRSIRATEGLLLVRNTENIHDQIEQLLASIRRTTGIIVTVEARFLEIRTTLMEQLGVEFFNLGGSSVPSLTEFSVNSDVGEDFVVSEPALRGPPDPDSGDPQVTSNDLVAGGLRESGDDTLAGVTGHAFGNIEQRAFTSTTDTFSNLLDEQGGTFQISILNDVSVNAIINAVRKDSRSREVTAPTLTLFNNQRGNVTFARQVAYIQDIDPNTAAGGVTPDPIPAIVNDNAFVLDVKPIVSADRRYVTLELRPTIARLLNQLGTDEAQIETFLGSNTTTTADVAVINPTTGIIETPNIEIRKVRTTVAVPDGGTMLIGGLTTVTKKDRESKVPVLGDIPVIGTLGNKQQDIKDNFQLIILIQPKITIMEEVEKRRFEAEVQLGSK